MKNKEVKKDFDAVAMMRSIRKKISAETTGMSLAELKRYIQNKKAEVNSKFKLV